MHGVATAPADARRADPRVVAEFVALLGERDVMTGEDALAVYERDASLEAARPDYVVFPRSAENVAAVVRLAVREGIPVVPRGAGTGLSGGAVPTQGGVMLVLTKMNRILEVDVENRSAIVEPGLVNVELSNAVAPDRLFYAPDPSSQTVCTLGGNVAENSGGPHCLAHGVTSNHVLGLELVLADGSIVWTGSLAPDRPGFDVTGLIGGSEGTLAIVTKIALRLMPQPEAVRTLLGIYESVAAASESVSATIAAGIVPVALEMMDGLSTRAVEQQMRVGYPDDAGAVLLIELEGLTEEVDAAAEAIAAICREHGARDVKLAASAAERARLWAGRKGARGALGKLAPNYYVHDVVVPSSKVPDALAGVAEISRKHGLPIATYLHAGDGNLHPNILFDARNREEMERAFAAGAEIVRLAIDLGGSITGEHGIGLEKKEFMPWLFGPDEIDAMLALRAALNPDDLLNPGKIFPAPAGCGELRGVARTAAAAASLLPLGEG